MVNPGGVAKISGSFPLPLSRIGSKTSISFYSARKRAEQVAER